MDGFLEKIIAGCCKGDLHAQRALFDRYQSVLLVLCLRYARDRPEAQDMLQEAFLAIFKDIGQYKGIGNFEGWMRKVTVRAALQFLRRRNVLRFAEDYADLPPNTLGVQPDTDLNSEAILQLVQTLPDGYRTIFNMHCMESFSYAEIAAELGIAESTVRSQYARACKHLRGMVEKMLSLPVSTPTAG
ncbi:MAG: RNA polymerase sigma factor [Bacteroidetes bacterium]|nr:RNA polymerase sigma factor [Bacteroidota bacterium]